MSTPDVSVIIVAFNSHECIANCIRSVEAVAHSIEVEILLVDNGDGRSANVVADQFPHVSIIESEGNVGFAIANNRLSSDARAEWLLFLNPDAVLDSGAIDALLEAGSKYPNVGVLGAVTLDAEGNPDMGNAIPLPSLREYWSVATGHARAGKAIPAEVTHDTYADVLSGSCLMVKASVFKTIGGFDERFFLYCEEVDLCIRLRNAGLDLVRVAKARVRHNVAHGGKDAPQRRLYQAAGNVEFMRKHWGKPKRLLGIALIWTGALARVVIGRTIGRRATRLRVASFGQRMVAFHPAQWMHGYHTERGLKARMDRGELSENLK